MWFGFLSSLKSAGDLFSKDRLRDKALCLLSDLSCVIYAVSNFERPLSVFDEYHDESTYRTCGPSHSIYVMGVVLTGQSAPVVERIKTFPRCSSQSNGVPDAKSNRVTCSGSDSSRIASMMSGASVVRFMMRLT